MRSWNPFTRCSHEGSECGTDRASRSNAAAGVTVMAAMSEARVAMMKAAANGPKNLPWSPDNSSIGVRTSTTTKVAYTTGARTSMAASNTTSRTGRA